MWGGSIWQSNVIVQQALQVLRTMVSMASITVSTRFSTVWSNRPANENVDRLTSEAWTGQRQNGIIPISGCPVKAHVTTRFPAQWWKLDWKSFTYLLEHYNTQIFSNGYSPFWHIIQFGHTLILNWCATQTWKISEYTVRSTWVIGGGIPKIDFLQEQRLCQSFVHPTRLTSTICWVISMPGRCISQLVKFDMISTGHLKSTPGL